jgi:protein-S-isoprenylcysteine O-methyltransferase Ste14
LDEAQIHFAACLGLILVAAAVSLMLRFVSAPYGRHRREGWGPQVPAWVGWMVMESPEVLLFVGVFFAGSHALRPVPLVLAAMWLLHYVYRSFVYPLKLKRSRTMPVSVVAMAFVFSLVNAYLNARWISELGEYGLDWVRDPRFILGVGLFFLGLRINRRADQRVLELQAEGKGYQIPRGGLHDYVASPNYLGEILQWYGWALATWSLAGFAFAVFTVANLAPRARTHWQWYRREFPDYPPHRKALIPFVW